MTIKSFLLVGVLAMSAAGIASAKSYHITLNEPSLAGANELKAGAYDIKVEGSQIVVTDEDHGKSITIPVTIERSDKKFDETQVESSNKGGKDNIVSIGLGGSNTKIVLGGN